MAQIKTQLLTASDKDICTAGELLQRGEVVAIPTETVYGLAADAFDPQAVIKIFEAKGRPADNPLIVHIAAIEDWEPLVTAIPPKARALADAFWPQALTIILPASERVPQVVTGGLSTVAVRFPAHPVAQAVIRAAKCPLAAPSANRSGSPSPTTAQRVAEDMDGRIAAIVDGGASDVGVESTVIDMSTDVPRLLRPGGITPAQLQSVIGDMVIDPAVTAALQEGQVAASPGMKYKHYAPRAKVVLVEGSPAAFAAFVNAQQHLHPTALCFDGEQTALSVPYITYGKRDDPAAQAHKLFDALRQLDDSGAQLVYAACPSADGVGLAVYNRLLRAAGFEVIHLD